MKALPKKGRMASEVRREVRAKKIQNKYNCDIVIGMSIASTKRVIL